MAILAIDPGETTGLAIRWNDGRLTTSMATAREDVWKLSRMFQTGDVIVIENFVTSGMISNHGLFTVRVIGGVEEIGWHQKIRVVRHNPGYRTAWLNKAISLMPPRSGHGHRHEKDAIAHLLAHEFDIKKAGDVNAKAQTGKSREAGKGEVQGVRAPIQELLERSYWLECDFRYSGHP